MPQVESVNIVGDMNNYYAGTVATHNGEAVKIVEFHTENSILKAYIHKLPRNASWGEMECVVASEIDFTMPRLGFVKYRSHWFYLSRNPQRRMRKGFHPDLIRVSSLGDVPASITLMDHTVIKQLWYGNTHRVNHDIVIHNNTLYFELDAVAHIQGENIQLVEGKEKLGEYVCKLWRNNSENVN